MLVDDGGVIFVVKVVIFVVKVVDYCSVRKVLVVNTVQVVLHFPA